MTKFKILTINPGSTSTKIAVFENETSIFEKTLRHSSDEINQYEKIYDQYSFRKKLIVDALEENKIDIKSIDAVVGRGGFLKPIESGTYKIGEKMLEDLKVGVSGEHASNLGGIIANEIAKPISKPSFIVDPVVVDELDDIARVSGVPELERKSFFHALNQKAVARLAAQELNKKYEEGNFIVAHIGGGVSVGAHKRGRVVEVNNALNGDGPFSPERSGGLPVWDLVKLCSSGKYSLDEIKKRINGKGGLVAYLGTNDGREVGKMMKEGNKKAELIYKAMAYQIAKYIGSCTCVLKGEVDAIILTGGIAYDQKFIEWIKEYISFIGKVIVYPGEEELKALAQGALRVLKGEEKAKEYK
ncbi:butyrate kinase [Anaerophilus nitritogenes]|uniref:butyrate kinase n=1 Tax=Anaerophilus nitritogenes TaxID=2498136 RepID=UPI00101C4C40|nr:butyrate kinase [Anaerophilus nitritogenes]